MANYPASISTLANVGATENVTPLHSVHHNTLKDELIATQTTLGVNPQGGSATVKARLDTYERLGTTLRRVAVQSATGTGAATTVSWDTEDQDIGGFWSTGTTITIPAGGAGIYGFTSRAVGAGVWTVPGSLIALKALSSSFQFDKAVSSTVLTGTIIVPLAVGDTVTVDVINGGTTQNMTATVWLYRVSV